jgi:hypothetical protein
MSEGAQNALKWLAAVVVLGLVVLVTARMAWTQLQRSVTFDTAPAAPDEDPDEQPAAPAIDTGIGIAAADLATAGGVVAQATAPLITLAPGTSDQVLVGILPVTPDPACITLARFEAFVADIQGAPTDLMVLPAVLPGITEAVDEQPLEDDPVLLESVPVSATAEAPEQWLSWDVTSVYVQAARRSGAGEPVVLAIRLADPNAPDVAVEIGALDHPDDLTARLHWEAVANCADIIGPPGEATDLDETVPPEEELPDDGEGDPDEQARRGSVGSVASASGRSA